jgi:hypothetical protein
MLQFLQLLIDKYVCGFVGIMGLKQEVEAWTPRLSFSTGVFIINRTSRKITSDTENEPYGRTSVYENILFLRNKNEK